MKGIFTEIKYVAQGSILREAQKVGMIVGVPVSTEQKKQMVPDIANIDQTPGDHEPEIFIPGNDPAFSYVDGDVLSSLRVWIRKSSQDKSEAIEMFYKDGESSPVTTPLTYGQPDTRLGSCAPIKRKLWALTGDVTGEIAAGGSSVTVHLPLSTAETGDTIVVGANDTKYIGVATGVIKSATETVYDITWITGYAYTGVDSASCIVLKVYYDYTSNRATGAKRAYVMYFDSVVFRTSIHGVYSIGSTDDIVDKFGDNALENPLSNLAFGSFMYAAANRFSSKFKICALDLRGVVGLAQKAVDDVIKMESLWSKTLKDIDNHKNAYFMCTMTGDETVQDIFEGYTISSSAMDKGREKRYYCAKPIIRIWNGDDREFQPFGDFSHIDQDMIDFSNKFGNGLYGSPGYTPGEAYEEGYQNTDGNVMVYFDPDTDVEIAKTVPMGVNNERITYIGCEYARVGNINIEGYYVSAIIAGWRASMELAYVANDMTVPLISSIPSRNGHYSEDLLDALSKSGWYMLQQEADGMPVKCYLQKTTAYDSVEKSEESFIVALDYCMADIKETLAPYIRGGLENRASIDNESSPVTKRYLGRLNSALSLVRYKYITKKEIFESLEVVSIKVNAMRKTGSDIVVKFKHYYIMSDIYVTAYVE